MSKLNLLGVTIDAITMEQAADEIVAYSKSTNPAKYITKPYVEFLDLAATNLEVRDLLNQSLLTLPDSVALQWAALYQSGKKRSIIRLMITLSQILTQPKALTSVIPERFAGADFSWFLLEKAATEKLSIYLIGHPQNGSITQTADAIQRRLPRLRVVGTFDGLKVNDHEPELLAELINLQPNLILIGIGFPRQERLMSRLAPKLKSGILIGEGGTFDYESFGGTIKRAPVIMRRLGLEWLWRLILQPKRIVRQFAIPRFIWKVYRGKKI